ncbi:MAG: 30S ribosomal protein S6 [Desulfuromonadaceae bacterium]|nr:30S ribosomal protein S6 [Desulfuromonadaceae bacterium]
MRTYETIFILNPQLVGDQYAAALDKYKGVLTEQNAEILKVAEWGTKRLAYPVKKCEQGIYVLVNYNAGNEVVREFERRMRIDESVIKFQTVLLENGLEPETAAAPVVDETDEEESDDAE